MPHAFAAVTAAADPPDQSPKSSLCPGRVRGTVILGCCQKVHKVRRSFPIFLRFECDIEVRCLAEQMEERPQREASRPIGFQAKVYPKAVEASLVDGG